jgi:hypothetical protein
MATNGRARGASLSFDPREQKIDAIQAAVKYVLGIGGCDGCGRIARLDVSFVVDPPPDLGRFGVKSATVT